MKGFQEKGRTNTADAAAMAVETAIRYNTDIVAASNTGYTIDALLEEKRKQNYTGTIIHVTHAQGFVKKDENELSEEKRQELLNEGVKVITSGHALSGAERGISSVFKGAYPVEIIAHTLRMFGAGVKVCVECALMAADNGAVSVSRPVVCVGGTGGGADTVCVITPSYSAKVFELKINEIVCKPLLIEG